MNWHQEWTNPNCTDKYWLQEDKREGEDDK